MAELNELIQKIDNPELRAQVQAAADKLFKQKKFGLVFEDHLPECTPLYDIPVHTGAKVSLKSGKVSETYTVLKIDGGKALCLPRDRSAAIEFPVDNLVTTAEFGDPIYPSLQALDSVCNAPDSDLWHTLIEADNYDSSGLQRRICRDISWRELIQQCGLVALKQHDALSTIQAQDLIRQHQVALGIALCLRIRTGRGVDRREQRRQRHLVVRDGNGDLTALLGDIFGRGHIVAAHIPRRELRQETSL